MELREVMGRRRSIRFLLPYKPVEPEKIQRMLAAARIASHWGNVQSLRAVVVFKDSASKAVRDALLGLPTKDFDVEVYGLAVEPLVNALGSIGRLNQANDPRIGDRYYLSLPRPMTPRRSRHSAAETSPLASARTLPACPWKPPNG